MEIFLCAGCGTEVVEKLEEPDSRHYARRTCPKCGRWHSFIPKPQNEGKRKDKNAKWRSMHKEKGFVCGFCGATEKEFPNSGQWDIDHIVQLCDGGSDIFENTLVLCTFCHTIKNAEQSRRKALRKELEQECQRKENDSIPW